MSVPETLDLILDELALSLHRSVTVTEDGTCIIVDPEVGTVTGRTKREAEAEIARRKAMRRAA
jgi:hypothetical protein